MTAESAEPGKPAGSAEPGKPAGLAEPGKPAGSAEPGMTAESAEPGDLVVGRIGRPHGVLGAVTVEVRTDDPDERFRPGAVLRTDPVERGPLTVRSVHGRSGGLVLAFEGVDDRPGAEALRETLLVIDMASLPALADPDEFYDHQLVGLAAVLTDGTAVGTVADVVHTGGGDLLAIADAAGAERLVPFVRAIVPRVDLPGGRVVLDPPDGLLEL
jgi:16S rRNA processing protein RimM